MQVFELDASDWKTSGDFISALKSAIGAPDWHGSSVNAFVDSMGTGGINAVEPPYVVRVVNTRNLRADVLDLVTAVSAAVERRQSYEAARTGGAVTVRLEIEN
jgi:hypothetical protein